MVGSPLNKLGEAFASSFPLKKKNIWMVKSMVFLYVVIPRSFICALAILLLILNVMDACYDLYSHDVLEIGIK